MEHKGEREGRAQEILLEVTIIEWIEERVFCFVLFFGGEVMVNSEVFLFVFFGHRFSERIRDIWLGDVSFKITNILLVILKSHENR